ncbi:TRAP transporter small permease [Alkalibacter saccharofermentans]|uniref:TRAP-type C4-dicarboxylate transport system, small permease component n=1 Tax=Alkalibacter saccharofermentans DSM 14828 TaxID=1120975 RepID=A0A1M5A7P5_9FIRM|nr:TRAP transporter small permease [Alkalibacter saccharofermentans]SHF25862.1 TRAP-type C4-dicarboxylate transport system, small permease component [Alkalibacter saccharofermentans DSM 14828]
MGRLFKIFDTLVKVATGGLFVSFIGIIWMQVFSRYVLNNSITWAEEFARYSFVWMIFLAGGIALDKRAYMGLDIIFNFFSDKKKKIIVLFTDVCVISFLVFLGSAGYEIVGRTMRQTSPALRIPLGYAYSAIPVGCLIMLIYAVRRMYVDIRNGKQETMASKATKQI